jgi:hypothetical protein
MSQKLCQTAAGTQHSGPITRHFHFCKPFKYRLITSALERNPLIYRLFTFAPLHNPLIACVCTALHVNQKKIRPITDSPQTSEHSYEQTHSVYKKTHSNSHIPTCTIVAKCVIFTHQNHQLLPTATFVPQLANPRGTARFSFCTANSNFFQQSTFAPFCLTVFHASQLLPSLRSLRPLRHLPFFLSPLLSRVRFKVRGRFLKKCRI